MTIKAHVGQAIYVNQVTGATYSMGFSYDDDNTALGRAWDLAKLAARLADWHISDLFVKKAW